MISDFNITTEDVIEAFRDMHDDYDDWWARSINYIIEVKSFDDTKNLAIK